MTISCSTVLLINWNKKSWVPSASAFSTHIICQIWKNQQDSRALGGGQSGLIDLIVSKPLDSEYFLEIIHGIEEISQQEGKDIVLTTIQHESELNRLDHAADRMTDGAILLLPRIHQ